MSFHLMADLKLQGETNEGKCYLLRIELCLPQIHMLRINSFYCPFLPSTMFSRMEGWMDGRNFFTKIYVRSYFLLTTFALATFPLIRVKGNILESS